jgi:hypothetical protein
MIIMRTDGGGTCYQNERLQQLKKVLESTPIETNILKLHDHKGNLTVYWDGIPTTQETLYLNLLWEFFNEYIVEHKFVEL